MAKDEFSEEKIKEILNNGKNLVQVSGASIIQTKKKVDKIEQDVIALHKKMILLL